MSGTVIVTGATGLIGRNIVRGLVERGHRVVGIDRRVDARAALVPKAIRREIDWVEGDTRDADLVQATTRSADAVIHLAAGASFLMYEEAPLEHTAGTIEGFHTVLEAVRRNGVEKFVYASTSAVYEGNEVPYNEYMTLTPPDLKAFAKKVNEEMAALYAQRYPIRPVALRPFSVYGEGELGKGKYANVVSLFSWAICGGRRPVVWGDGRQTRDFVHVSDVARAFLLALDADPSIPYCNVGTGVETSFLELIALICEKVGVAPDPLFVETPIDIYAQRLVADTELSRNGLGFTPEVSLEAGVARVVENVQQLQDDPAWAHLRNAQTVLLNERERVGTGPSATGSHEFLHKK